jgi:hypothetical protein
MLTEIAFEEIVNVITALQRQLQIAREALGALSAYSLGKQRVRKDIASKEKNFNHPKVSLNKD